MSAGRNPVPNSIPTRWQPGESGNPKGHSEQRRRAKRLRRAVDAILEQPAPSEWLQRVPSEIARILPPDCTIAEIVAVRGALIATTALDDKDALAAMRTILAATAKPDQAAPVERGGAPVLPSTEERRRAIALELGLETPDES